MNSIVFPTTEDFLELTSGGDECKEEMNNSQAPADLSDITDLGLQ